MTTSSSLGLLAEDALEGFSKRFSSEAAHTWSAPGRVNLIGEHTDYNNGFVFPLAIDRYTVVALATRNDDQIRVASSFSDTGHEMGLHEISPTQPGMNDWADYPFGVAWALSHLRSADGEPRGFDAYFVSDVPVGAGLSSSAAIECALAVALNEVWGLRLNRRELARACQRAENDIVGAPTGIMDQTASLLGQADHAVFIDCRDLSADIVPLGFAEAGLALAVIDTRVSHRHADGGYASRRAACDEAVRVLGLASLRELTVADLADIEPRLDEVTFRRVRHVVTENARVLETVASLRKNGPGSIGELLLDSHASMRDDYEISIPELDLAVDVAMACGAVGARMTGGGFGGAAIAVIDQNSISALTEAVTSAFDSAGFDSPNVFFVTAADGAH